jgi:glycosyltransferase involved in cell wall biosynthesis
MAPELITGGGIRRYAVELRRALAARDDVSLISLGPEKRARESAAQRIAQGLTREGWHYTAGVARAARAAHADVVHCPGSAAPETAGGVPLVLTVHDVLPLSHPELFTPVMRAHQRLTLGRRARRADRVMTWTEASRDELVRLLGVDSGRVRVIGGGVGAEFAPGEPDRQALRERHGIDRPFVLCVGTLEPRKNLVGALRAMALAETGEDVQLVVAGGRGWRNEAFEAELARTSVPVVMTGRVEDAELAELYRAAELLVFPSLWEGYGLPVLEAMACGCPVIASNRSSIPEAAGGAGVLVDPEDPAVIAAMIRALLDDDALRDDLRARGLERAAGHSWADLAERTVGVYREVAS